MASSEINRVAINLSNYFHDHRSTAWILINKETKRIRDIEHRISSIFDLDDFYLSCKNNYLPAKESVEIINPDDVLWVFPKSGNVSNEATSILVNGEESAILEPDKVVKKKKKKAKKRKYRSTDRQSINSIDVQEEEKVVIVKKKTKNHIYCQAVPLSSGYVVSLNNHNNELSSIRGDNDDDSNSDSKGHPESSLSRVKSTVHKIEQSIVSLNKPPPILPPQKKINIVKTIVISNKKPMVTDESIVILNDQSITADNNEENLNNKVEAEDNDKGIDDTDLGLQLDQTTLLTDSSFSIYADNVGDNITKRKRKRVRKRKSNKAAVNTNTPETYNQVLLKPVIVPLIESDNNRIHIRFDKNDGDNIQDDETAVKSIEPNQINNDNIMLVCDDNASSISKISENNNVVGIGENLVDDEDYIGIDLNRDIPLKEEFILRQPLLKQIIPQVNDIIAFKMLRMSENYTPEISGFITGKLINVNADSKEVTLDIFHGLDQCKIPQGKFSLTDDDDEKPPDENLTFRELVWSDLLEPRLIYP